MSELLKTPLFDWHKANGAKTAPFAGWDMPIQYAGIIAEHLHTRELASLFDICHMGEFIVTGDGAKENLGALVTHNLATLKPGRCRYGFMLNPSGGIIDDLIVYCLEEDKYMLVVNGARTKVDFDWLAGRLDDSISLTDISDKTAKIDIQGPASVDITEDVLGLTVRDLPYFGFKHVDFNSAQLMISRTGYTGELGFELYIHPEQAQALWDVFIADERVKPAGLGARDTLRLEIGLSLYGQDLDERHTPAEAGFTPMLKSEALYVGKGSDRNIREVLIPLALEGRRSARHGDSVLLDGKAVGRVTSGSFAPSLGHAIALAYVSKDAAEAEAFEIQTTRVALPAKRVSLPFYPKGTARTKLT